MHHIFPVTYAEEEKEKELLLLKSFSITKRVKHMSVTDDTVV